MAAPMILFRRCPAKIILLTRTTLAANSRLIPVVHYAAMKKVASKTGKLGPVAEKKKLPVETDPEKLVNYVCGSNIMKEGEDIKLKPDSEYPDWLWTLRLGKPPSIDEMDENTLEYWEKLHDLHWKRYGKLLKGKKFVEGLSK